MSADVTNYVVADRPCWVLENEPDEWVAEYCDGAENRGCEGCLGGGNGRRLDFTSAVPVEKGSSTYARRMSDGHMSLIMRDGEAWWPLEAES